MKKYTHKARRREAKPLPWSFRTIMLLAMISWFLASVASADTFRVGAGGVAQGCTHSSLGAALIAAAFTAGGDTIIVAKDQTYVGERHDLSGYVGTVGQLELRGGYDTCTSDLDPEDRTTLGGPGMDAMFDITNSSRVAFYDFELSDTTGDYAIDLQSNAGLYLENVIVRDNKGGVRASGDVTAVMSGVQCIGNDAGPTGEGGGLHCTDASIELISVSLGGNSAYDGGGMWIGPDCSIDIDGNLLLVQNAAERDGGAIFLNGGTLDFGGLAFINLYDNEAKHGGGLFMTGLATAGNVILTIEDNRAERGAGIHLDAGSELFADRARLHSNELTGIGTTGSAAYVSGGSRLQLTRGSISGHSAAMASNSLIYVDGSVLELEHLTIAGNATETLVSTDNTSAVTAGFLTVADNPSSTTAVTDPLLGILRANSTFRLFASVVLDTIGFGFQSGGALTFADCIMSDNLTGIPAATRSTSGTPFVGGSLTLEQDSTGVDYCDLPGGYSPIHVTDALGTSITQDEGNNTNGSPGVPGGTVDLGGEQYRRPVQIFTNGFESGNTAAWN